MQAFKALQYSEIRTGASRAQLGAALSDGLVASFDCTDTVEGTLLGYARGETLLEDALCAVTTLLEVDAADVVTVRKNITLIVLHLKTQRAAIGRKKKETEKRKKDETAASKK
jgi:hypothetical protein